MGGGGGGEVLGYSSQRSVQNEKLITMECDGSLDKQDIIDSS